MKKNDFSEQFISIEWKRKGVTFIHLSTKVLSLADDLIPKLIYFFNDNVT